MRASTAGLARRGRWTGVHCASNTLAFNGAVAERRTRLGAAISSMAERGRPDHGRRTSPPRQASSENPNARTTRPRLTRAVYRRQPRLAMQANSFAAAFQLQNSAVRLPRRSAPREGGVVPGGVFMVRTFCKSGENEAARRRDGGIARMLRNVKEQMG